MTGRTPTIDTARARATMTAAITGCTSCDQRFVGRGPVLPSGPTPNDLMILFDSPTYAEDRARRVTNDGDAGRLLYSELRKAGVDPTRAFSGFVVSCWPGPTNQINVGLQRACTHNLRAQIRACDPKVILALGAVALSAVTDRKRSLAGDRGKPFLVQAGPAIDRWVFPTWHPAGFKYDGRDRSKVNTFSADIASAVRLLREVS